MILTVSWVKSETHTGWDLVKQNGKSGSFQQWFYGYSDSEGLHGEHSQSGNSKDGTCPDNFPESYSDHDDPNHFWGDHRKMIPTTAS
jgi:hypothetical protein